MSQCVRREMHVSLIAYIIAIITHTARGYRKVGRPKDASYNGGVRESKRFFQEKPRGSRAAAYIIHRRRTARF